MSLVYSGKEEILLVGAEPAFADRLVGSLGERYTLATADDGRQALAHLSESPPTDLVMPVAGRVDMALPEFYRLACDCAARLPDFVILESADTTLVYDDFPPDHVDFVSADAPIARIEARVERNLLQRRSRRSLESRIAELDERLRGFDTVLVETLLRCSAHKDDEYGRHVQRINAYSSLLARLLGMPESYVRTIGLASMLHDIGKVSVPDAILQKPGKLDAEEWELVKQHCAEGASILGDPGESPLLSMTRRIILSHHEKWDGTGYPAGLAGRDIPLEGRIVGLADVLDALTTDLPYKKAWSMDEATRYIRGQAGGHFDPELVALLLQNVKQFDSIRVRLADILVEEEAAERR